MIITKRRIWSGIICEELIEEFMTLENMGKIDKPKMAIGVFLDHHALGKRMVTSIIKAKGYDVIDFGQGLSVDEIVRRTIDEDIEVLLISTLMLTSALKIKIVAERLRKSDKKVKIIVGGAPFRFDCNLWKKVGADADGKNATDIISVIEGVTK